MSLKGRINKLEKDNKPKPEAVKYIVEWSEATGDPVKDAELRANRPTHNEAGEKITYVDWGDEIGIPGPDVADDSRIKWAEDVLGAGSDEDAPNQGAIDE